MSFFVEQQPAPRSPAIISNIICFTLRLLWFTVALSDVGVTNSLNTNLKSGQ